jgi:ATPase subunit of ABC transporter with duplicated ATPase domains
MLPRTLDPERLGGKVIEVKNVSKAYGDKLLFEDLSFTLPPGGIVGSLREAVALLDERSVTIHTLPW